MRDKLTKGDIEKMQKEIEYRELELRPGLIEEVKETRAQGDLSENFEYHAAKRAKNRNDSRIRYLQNMIKTAQIVEDESAEDEIGMDTKVTLFDEDQQCEDICKIVTTVRSNPLKGLISIESPLGKALLGKKVGDRVLIKVNDNFSYYVQVKAIEKNVGEDDDKIRGY